MTETTEIGLTPLAREILACLSTGLPGVSVPDLAADAFERPLYGPPQPDVPGPQRNRLIYAALPGVRALLRRGTGDAEALYLVRDGVRRGETGCIPRRYAVTPAALRWVRDLLQQDAPAEGQAHERPTPTSAADARKGDQPCCG